MDEDLQDLSSLNDEYRPSAPAVRQHACESDNEEEGMHERQRLDACERVGLYMDTGDHECGADIFLSVQEKFQDGCSCSNKCYQSLDVEEIHIHILQMRELSKEEKDMYLMGKLKSKGITGSEKPGKRKRYMYSFDDREVCKHVFLFAHDIGEKSLKNLQKHMKENDMVPRVHGNIGRKPKHALTFETVKFVVQFILNYATQHGLPQPAATNRKESEPPIFLPASTTQKAVHVLYVQSCEEAAIRAVKLTSFRDIWRTCCSHIQIPTPRTDVCHTCEKLKDGISSAVTENAKLEASNVLIEHVSLSQSEHNIYVEDVKKARNELSQFGDRPEGVLPPCSNDLINVHYTVDFAQQVSLPQHARQVGPIFFATSRKVQIFGVCMEGCRTQYNFMIDESETIGQDGKNAHGPDAVLSMLHHVMMKYGYGEMACTLHADNCSGQNKNLFMIGYLAWRVMIGLHREITLKFQVVGHTRCLVDAGFAQFKKLYRRSDCDTMQHIMEVMNQSSRSNKAVSYTDGNGENAFEWHDWKTFLAEHFSPVKGIRKYRHFRFSSLNPGTVFVKESSEGVEVAHRVLKRATTVFDGSLPTVLKAGGLSEDRQAYLYQTIRPFVRDAYKDTLCPPPVQRAEE